MMTVREILADWLTAHGYDGLACVDSSDEKCCCGLGELLKCISDKLDSCVAGKASATAMRRDFAGELLGPWIEAAHDQQENDGNHEHT